MKLLVVLLILKSYARVNIFKQLKRYYFTIKYILRETSFLVLQTHNNPCYCLDLIL